MPSPGSPVCSQATGAGLASLLSLSCLICPIFLFPTYFVPILPLLRVLVLWRIL